MSRRLQVRASFSRRLAAIAFCMVTAWAAANSASGQPGSGWIGRKVMPRADCRVMIGNQEVKNVGLPYTVRGVKEGWLDIGSGYVRPDQVVELENAVGYYTDYLRGDPQAGGATTVAAWLGRIKVNTTRRSPISARPCGSIPTTARPSITGDMPGD